MPIWDPDLHPKHQVAGISISIYSSLPVSVSVPLSLSLTHTPIPYGTGRHMAYGYAQCNLGHRSILQLFLHDFWLTVNRTTAPARILRPQQQPHSHRFIFIPRYSLFVIRSLIAQRPQKTLKISRKS